nr:MAG TPA: hypothetical protein [Caudoviricetes sp.]
MFIKSTVLLFKNLIISILRRGLFSSSFIL